MYVCMKVNEKMKWNEYKKLQYEQPSNCNVYN